MSDINKIICQDNERFCICECDIAADANLVLNNPDYDKVNSVYEFTVRSIKGEIIRLQNYKGYVCIFANMATRSPFSDFNIKLFNDLYEIYYPWGLRILGFPCNQFNNGEPGDAFEIMRYAARNKVKWDIFEKTDVNGPTACELFKYIKQKAPGPRLLGESVTLLIKNDYTKFIVNRSGIPDQRFPPHADFKTMETALLFYLGLDKPIVIQRPRFTSRNSQEPTKTEKDSQSTKSNAQS